MATAHRRRRRTERTAEGGADQVIAYVRGLIERKALRPGDRLPAERELAGQIGVSRPTVRMGLHALAAMGIVQSRHGAGTFIPAGPPALGSGALSLQAALHDITHAQMYEARRILEVGAAGLAAESATPDQITSIAEEVAGLFASMDNPQRFLVHDINFHWLVAVASGNPIIAAVVEMVSTLYYEQRRETAERASDLDLRDAAEAHRDIYQAIRARDADAARRLMNEHLLQASAYQAQEPAAAARLKPRAPAVGAGVGARSFSRAERARRASAARG
jgi:GntR family transcriptional repressor for pyruvate dehydrogenase complex